MNEDRYKKYLFCRKILNISFDKSSESFLHAIDEFSSFSFEEVKIFERELNRYKHKLSRVNNYINVVLNQPDVFWCTFTISSDHINLKYSTFMKWFNKHLKDFVFVGNCDYGDNSGRLHFHLLISYYHNFNAIWPYGFSYCVPVHHDNDKAFSRYICKLRAHAIKNSTKSNHKLISNSLTRSLFKCYN